MSKPLSFDANEYETSTANDVFVTVTALAGLMLVMLILSVADGAGSELLLLPQATKQTKTTVAIIIQSTIHTIPFLILLPPLKVERLDRLELLVGAQDVRQSQRVSRKSHFAKALSTLSSLICSAFSDYFWGRMPSSGSV
jgi:hypothetical protein